MKIFDNSAKVFYRGQNEDYEIIPSIFRKINAKIKKKLSLRINAYNELKEDIPKKFDQYRFYLEGIDPILQHYGIRTPWIDLVDNLFVALWFASHEPIEKKEGIKYSLSKNEYGWLYFLTTRLGDSKLIYEDLREKHSSLSLRLHTQHGISAKRDITEWTLNDISLEDFVIARVKFKIDENWFKGNLFSQSYLFPNEKLDNTYKLLKSGKFSLLLEEINKKYSLKNDELGHIVQYSEVNKK